jgi:hypothetical protein
MRFVTAKLSILILTLSRLQFSDFKNASRRISDYSVENYRTKTPKCKKQHETCFFLVITLVDNLTAKSSMS